MRSPSGENAGTIQCIWKEDLYYTEGFMPSRAIEVHDTHYGINCTLLSKVQVSESSVELTQSKCYGIWCLDSSGPTKRLCQIVST